MSVLVTEDFAGGAAALGGVWTQCGPAGTATVNRNGSGLGTQSATDASNDRFVRWNAATPSVDHYAELTVQSLVSAVSFCEVCARMSGDAGTFACYVAYTDGVNGAGHTELSKWSAGSPTVLANYSPAAAFAAGNRLRIHVIGNQIYVFKNGVLLTPSTGGNFVTDSALGTGSFGFGGFWGSGATPPTFDDFEGGDFADSARAARSAGLGKLGLGQLGRRAPLFSYDAPSAPPASTLVRRTLHQLGTRAGSRGRRK